VIPHVEAMVDPSHVFSRAAPLLSPARAAHLTSGLMGKLIGATGVAAVASQLRRIAGIITILAAILVVAGRDAIAGRMSTFLDFSHNSVRPTFPTSDGSAA
jgi:hypothetical protein